MTGARVKIGYQAAIMLLRSGARVIVLTRFPVDAAARYAREDDFSEWGDRLEIHGIDLRHTPSVELLCAKLLETHDRLDFLINNACQTVRRPPGFYRHMMENELAIGSTARAGPGRGPSRGRPDVPALLSQRKAHRRRPPRPDSAVPPGPSRRGPAAGGPPRAELLAAAPA